MDDKNIEPAATGADENPFPHTNLEDWSAPRVSTSRDILPHHANRRGEIEAAERLLQAEVDRLSAQRTRLTELGRMSGSLREKIKQREEYLQKLKGRREALKSEHATLRDEIEAVHQKTLAARQEMQQLTTQNSTQPRAYTSRALKLLLLVLVIGLGTLGYARWQKSEALVQPIRGQPIKVQIVAPPQIPQAGLYDGTVSVEGDVLQLRPADQITSPLAVLKE